MDPSPSNSYPEILQSLLYQGVFDVKQPYTQNVFKLIGNDLIEAFFQRSGCYDHQKRRWVDLPVNEEDEENLYLPFQRIFKHILSQFDCDKGTSARAVIDSRNDSSFRVLSYDHLPYNAKLYPPIMITGRGPNFHPNARHSPDYETCISPCEIWTEEYANDPDGVPTSLEGELGVYSRECFMAQNNRYFVLSLVVTEERAQLYQFDRSGVWRFAKVNIHQQPDEFVRLVVGIASQDDKGVGFDTSVFWRRNQRYIRTHNELGESIEYPLTDDAVKYATKKGNVSPGTTCWNAVGPDGDPLLIKDSWRSNQKVSEATLMRNLRGLDGVVHMVSYENGPCFSELTGIHPTDFGGAMLVRCRIVMKAYGKTITHFTSREEFLYAFRDAVAGHRNSIWNRGILHRDVSLDNIVLGGMHARPGSRGILIDLDMAIQLDSEKDLVGVDYEIGTHYSQSQMVLSSERLGPNPPPHDYLDDLESFFYVFCWICGSFKDSGIPVDSLPLLLEEWSKSKPFIAGEFKENYLLGPSLLEIRVTDYFGKVFQDLLDRMHEFFADIISRKQDQQDFKARYLTLDEIKANATEHYAIFLYFIDEAINAMVAENASGSRPSVSQPSSAIRVARLLSDLQGKSYITFPL